jgi:hypothetical protein
LDDNEDNLANSAASPLKKNQAVTGEETCEPSSVKKNLDFDNEEPSSGSEVKVSGTNTTNIPLPPSTYTDPRDRLKLRKTTASNDLATSAAPSMEDRRAQLRH